MASLIEKIKEDVKTAMREKEAFKRDTLRTLQGAIKQVEVDERRELSDADVEKIIQKQIKQRQDAIEQYKAGGRQDLVDKEQGEVAIIETYLPKQMTDAELEAALKMIIARVDQKAMGPVMAEARVEIGTKADGKRMSQMIKALLG